MELRGTTAVLRGNYTAKIDDKGRLKLPNALRSLVEAIVWNSGHSDVGVRFSTPRGSISNAGQELKKRGLSGGRESDEACTQDKKRSVYPGLHG